MGDLFIGHQHGILRAAHGMDVHRRSAHGNIQYGKKTKTNKQKNKTKQNKKEQQNKHTHKMFETEYSSEMYVGYDASNCEKNIPVICAGKRQIGISK